MNPSFVLLGADAYLAARPATPVQLAHACRAAGYVAAIPATWGDELVAVECARRLAGRTLPPAIFCACPRVRERLLASGHDLASFLVTLAAPPVAAARYLRQLYHQAPLTITYVGDCPAGSDSTIDHHITPGEFFADLTARQISIEQQPLVFDSMFAPDRRRCFSSPGGLPVEELVQGVRAFVLAAGVPEPLVPRNVAEITTEEYAADLAQYLILHDAVLLDVAPRLGCACSGATAGTTPPMARGGVRGLEPPRSPTPVVERDLAIDLGPRVDVPTAPVSDMTSAASDALYGGGDPLMRAQEDLGSIA